MPPKNKNKGPVIIDGIDTSPMTREQLETFAQRIKEENDREREERNFFQLERDKLRTFWEITRNELEEARAKLRNKDRQIEEEREVNDEELKFYKQKVKHLQFEHQHSITDTKAEASVMLKNASDYHNEEEKELLRDKRDLKTGNKDQDYFHQEQVKSLKIQHSEELGTARGEFYGKARELELKYDRKFNSLKEELDNKHKTEIFEIEERKGLQINELTKAHDKAYYDLKNYYNDITLNNLALISSLKGQMETLRKQNERMTKQVKDLTADNRKLAEPLKALTIEATELRRRLQNYNKDKTSLANTAALLRAKRDQFSELTWQNEALELRYEKMQAERDELQKKFLKGILEVQQKSCLKTEFLYKRIEHLKETTDDRELIIEQLIAESENPTKPLNLKFREILADKNREIGDLKYELSRICRAHDDIIETYEEKLVQFGIPKQELGFQPLRIIPDGQSGLARAPAGLVTRNR